MRKPKIHPEYGIDLVGINFRERWNVVQQATREEIEKYKDNHKFLIENKRQGNEYWSWKEKTAPVAAENTQMRRLWRKRFSESFKEGILYKVDRSIYRYTQKLGTPSCAGTMPPYYVDRHREYRLHYGDVLVLNHRDELGTLYFSKIQNIGSKYTYAFTRDSSQLCGLVPIES